MNCVRLVSWLSLSNRTTPSSFQERSSALDAVVSLGARDTTEVREAFAIAIAQLLGWELFGAFALRAAGIDGDPAHHREAVHESPTTTCALPWSAPTTAPETPYPRSQRFGRTPML